ncbi:MAG: hypothetical protein ACI822_002267 [Gammaproteobacteria bacterium]|jgi:hypothetical protein
MRISIGREAAALLCGLVDGVGYSGIGLIVINPLKNIAVYISSDLSAAYHAHSSIIKLTVSSWQNSFSITGYSHSNY